MDAALEQVMATMHGITPVEKKEDTHVGPVPTVTAKLEGIPVEALLDTGSSVSIVALDFLLEALARQRPKDQSLKHWEESVKKRLERPGMTLKSYGKDELLIIRQTKCWMSCGNHSVEATLQVQKGAPVKLLTVQICNQNWVSFSCRLSRGGVDRPRICYRRRCGQ